MNHWLKQKHNLHLWEISDGELHWYSAESKEEAISLYFVDGSDYDETEVEVRMWPDEATLQVRDEDEGLQTKTAHEWCCDGKGYVASTVF